jgi:hypothetical protein
MIANIVSVPGKERGLSLSSPPHPDQHWEATKIFSIGTGQIVPLDKTVGLCT